MAVLEPIIRAGETYTLPGELSREAVLAYWCSDHHDVFVGEDDGEVVGTYFLRANQGSTFITTLEIEYLY